MILWPNEVDDETHIFTFTMVTKLPRVANANPAVSQADLLNAERFEHIDSSADSGRGDGKYLDLSSVKSVTAPNGHRRIEAVIYVSMPAANMIQGLSVQYDYQMDRSLRHLINDHDRSLKQGDKTPYISIWRAKQGSSGSYRDR